MGGLSVIADQYVCGKRFVVYGTAEKPLFLAKDVAEWIGHSKTSMMLSSVDEEEKLRETILTSGQEREMWFLTEDGLYEVLMLSRKEIAKVFKKEVKRILKSLRKDGGYIVGQEQMTGEEFLAKALIFANNKLIEKEALLAEKQARIEQMKPKEIFADAVSASHTSILIGDLAKLIQQNGVDIGQKRLFDWMRSNGYLIKQKGVSWNMPTQRAMEQGLFEVKESTSMNPDGSVRITKTTKVTGKGQVFFINKFMEKKNEKDN